MIDLVYTKVGSQINLKLVSKPEISGNSRFDINTPAGKLMNLLNSLKVLGRSGPFENINTILEKGTGSNFAWKESPEIEKLAGKLLDLLEKGQTSKSAKPSAVFKELEKVVSSLITKSGLSTSKVSGQVKTEPFPITSDKPLDLPIKFLNLLKDTDVDRFFQSIHKESLQVRQSGDRNLSVQLPEKKSGVALPKTIKADFFSIQKSVSKLLDVLHKNQETTKIISPFGNSNRT